MSTNNEREALRAKLRLWGSHRRALENRRDTLVREALAVKISKEEVHQSMGIARTTLDRIGKAADDDA